MEDGPAAGFSWDGEWQMAGRESQRGDEDVEHRDVTASVGMHTQRTKNLCHEHSEHARRPRDKTKIRYAMACDDGQEPLNEEEGHTDGKMDDDEEWSPFTSQQRKSPGKRPSATKEFGAGKRRAKPAEALATCKASADGARQPQRENMPDRGGKPLEQSATPKEACIPGAGETHSQEQLRSAYAEAEEKWSKCSAYKRWRLEKEACAQNPSRATKLFNALSKRREEFFCHLPPMPEDKEGVGNMPKDKECADISMNARIPSCGGKASAACSLPGTTTPKVAPLCQVRHAGDGDGDDDKWGGGKAKP